MLMLVGCVRLLEMHREPVATTELTAYVSTLAPGHYTLFFFSDAIKQRFAICSFC